MTKNLTPAAFLKMVNADARTAADVTAASAYLKRSAYQTALWAHVRIATDGVDAGTVAVEAGVTGGRISQIRYGVNAMLRAGIPLPVTTDAATVAEETYLHLSRVYKSGKAARGRIKDAVAHAETLADLDAKHAALCAVEPDTADDNKRGGRPEGNNKSTTDTDDDKTGTPAVGGTAPVEAPSTVADRVKALIADVKNGTPIPDLDVAMALVDELSDAVAARAGLTVDA